MDNSLKKKPLLIITGQTATGKTKLALMLAKNQYELVNADARQIYQKLDIVTGKDISAANFQAVQNLDSYQLGFYKEQSVKIWLYDILDPALPFSSTDWLNCAKMVFSQIYKEKKTPLVVGGSYFYLKQLFENSSGPRIKPNWHLREELENFAVSQLQEKLQKDDPERFNLLNNSDKNNKRRLIRWIEKRETGKPQIPKKKEERKDEYETKIIGLRFKDKNKLREKIKQRIEERLEKGALEEVEILLKQGYNEKSFGLQTIGYQQLIQYLKNNLSLSEAKAIWLNKEYQYAKRQLTFMKTNPYIIWYNIDQIDLTTIVKGVKLF